MSFQASMLAAIRNEPDFERAVLMSEWLARFLFSNACGVYRLDELEAVPAARLPLLSFPTRTDREPELHIASELYTHGGHTRLVKALISEIPANAAVLVTRPATRASLLSILGISDERLHVVDVGDARHQVEQIASVVAGYKRVVLHVHPDDVICCIALRSLRRAQVDLQVALVNHSDHTFSVGIGLADTILEISTFGWALRQSRGTEDKSSFIGIPLYSAPAADGPSVIPGMLLSAGSSYKFKPQAERSLPAVLSSVLKDIPEARLLVIGPKKIDPWWWLLKLRYRNRVAIQQRIPHADYLRQLQLANVYLDSFPITGGTAFTEALLLGCNVAGLMGASLGYGAADRLRSRDAVSFTKQIADLIDQREATLAAQREVRAAAARLHAPAAVRARLNKSCDDHVLFPPPEDFILDVPCRSFEQAWLQQRSVSAAGFRTARQARVLSVVAVRLARAFGLQAASLMPLFARAVFALVTRRGAS